ncbi:site-specific integrase [Lactobacillus delbrueckii]|uniref:site-specific integrase n=1 Tax=Lactobacillus delbrueckii TaxID=1584 RepID=UPI001F1D5096|nr:site-specific integrase [Lactobacillus delbrueckii]GHN43060.1 integrase [Lactobacillus delbrueckii]
MRKKTNFCEYVEKWINTYKSAEVRPVTLRKWYLALDWMKKAAGDMILEKMTRSDVQQIVNFYGRFHSYLTTKDFTRFLFAPLRDAYHDQLIDMDITYRVRATSQVKDKQKNKWLEAEDASKLCKALEDDHSFMADLCILMLKTGLRYAEALGLTPADIDTSDRTITVNKTYNYKLIPEEKEFMPTKNWSSMRTISVDILTLRMLQEDAKDVPEGKSIYITKYAAEPPAKNGRPRSNKTLYNATVNGYLKAICKRLGIPAITVHGLRHTHASLLIANGASIQYVAERLGHANTETTQRVYIHLLEKRRKQDEQKMATAMMELGV